MTNVVRRVLRFSSAALLATLVSISGTAQVNEDYKLTTAGDVGVKQEAHSNRVSLVLNFSIERSNKPFKELRHTNLAATLEKDNQPRKVEVREGDLRTESVPPGVVFVLDNSLSMVRQSQDATSLRVDKLTASKTALKTFIERLRDDEPIAIMEFAEDTDVVFPPSTSKSDAKRAADGIAPAYGKQLTYLYRAFATAIQYASSHRIRNVVFLTDGVEDTVETRSFAYDSQRNEYNESNHSSIVAAAHDAGVRLHTIGIGDREGVGLAFVDMDALDRLSRQTTLTDGHYVSIPELSQSLEQGTSLDDALRGRLDDVLKNIQDSFHYDYVLTLTPPIDLLVRDGQRHKVQIECTLEDTVLPVTFYYSWNPDDAFIRAERAIVEQRRRTFIQPPVSEPGLPNAPIGQRSTLKSERVSVGTLSAVFASYAGVLLLLAFIPLVGQWRDRKRVRASVASAVIVLDKRSPLIGQSCPNEGQRHGATFLFRADDAVVVCPRCQTAHHLGCWHMNGDACMLNSCRQHLPISQDLLAAHGEEN